MPEDEQRIIVKKPINLTIASKRRLKQKKVSANRVERTLVLYYLFNRYYKNPETFFTML